MACLLAFLFFILIFDTHIVVLGLKYSGMMTAATELQQSV
jgi:hypothetical protein